MDVNTDWMTEVMKIRFILVLAWIIAPLSLILTVVCIHLQSKYNNSLEKMIDRSQGFEKSYNETLLYSLLIFIGSISFILLHMIWQK